MKRPLIIVTLLLIAIQLMIQNYFILIGFAFLLGLCYRPEKPFIFYSSSQFIALATLMLFQTINHDVLNQFAKVFGGLNPTLLLGIVLLISILSIALPATSMVYIKKSS